MTLKPSQSTNLDKVKNELRVKRTKDVRSVLSFKDLNLKNDEN